MWHCPQIQFLTNTTLKKKQCVWKFITCVKQDTRSSNGSLQGRNQKPNLLLRALGARRVTRIKFHTENSQILSTTLHPWFTGYRNQTECYEISCYKRMSPFLHASFLDYQRRRWCVHCITVRAIGFLLLNDRRKFTGHGVSVPSTARSCEVS
jgi:hypothetical protein